MSTPQRAPPAYQQSSPADSSFIDVEAWNENTLAALSRLSLAKSTSTNAPPVAPVRGTSNPLAIPLDGGAPVPVLEGTPSRVREGMSLDDGIDGGVAVEPERTLRRVPSRRDSMKRREALLKGNEGSRRRQKWENDRLLGNPFAQPPLPTDWEVRPTHNVQSVPYYLASLWDAKRAEDERKAAAKAAAKANKKRTSSGSGHKRRSSSVSSVAVTVIDQRVGRVPKQLKDTMKRSAAAKHMLTELEVEVRNFVEGWNKANKKSDRPQTPKTPDQRPRIEDDDDFVMVTPGAELAEEPVYVMRPEKLVLDGPVADQQASFGRWLVHALGDYYGLDTWSVTTGNPARREAYIGLLDGQPRRIASSTIMLPGGLPRPLCTRV